MNGLANIGAGETFPSLGLSAIRNTSERPPGGSSTRVGLDEAANIHLNSSRSLELLLKGERLVADAAS
jgi:hypothetical protein